MMSEVGAAMELSAPRADASSASGLMARMDCRYDATCAAAPVKASQSALSERMCAAVSGVTTPRIVTMLMPFSTHAVAVAVRYRHAMILCMVSLVLGTSWVALTFGQPPD